MVLDRIAQIALIFFGALILVLLVMGLSVSCRGTSADPLVTLTVPVPGFPGDSVIVTLPASSPTPTPSLAIDLFPTGTPGTTGDALATTQPGLVGSPVATAAPNQPAAPVATAVPPPGASGMVPGMTARHAVSRGEWVLQIARCYSVPPESILAANSLADPDYILPGWILTVPNIGSLGGRIVGPPCVVSYNVAAGDTWESLAQRYGTTPAILRRANPGALSIGRAIWVPRIP